MAIQLATTADVAEYTRSIGWAGAVPLTAVKDVDINRKEGLLTAYLTVYFKGSNEPIIDDYGDFVAPGSFTKTISDLTAAKNAKHSPYLTKNLWQHNPNWVTGGVVSLSEDSAGVIYETKMAKGVRLADEVLELAAQKMVGSSFGYVPIRVDKKSIPNVRKILELALHEVSQVAFPANEYAPIIGVKDGSIWPRVWALGGVPSPEEKKELQEGGYLETPPPEPQTKQARDFATILAQHAPDELMREFYNRHDLLSIALLEAIRDDKTDTNPAIDANLSQYGDTVRAWAKEYEGLSTDEQDSMGMYGWMSAERAAVSVKAFSTWYNEETKKGMVLSATSRERISQALTLLQDQLQDLTEFVSQHTPAKEEENEGENPPLDVAQAFPKFYNTPAKTPDRAGPFTAFPLQGPLQPSEDLVTLVKEIRAGIGL